MLTQVVLTSLRRFEVQAIPGFFTSAKHLLDCSVARVNIYSVGSGQRSAVRGRRSVVRDSVGRKEWTGKTADRGLSAAPSDYLATAAFSRASLTQ
jgi:hypothetical protein